MDVHPSIATHPNVDQWLEFTADERIVVHTGKVDIGQRISTALAIIAAEELDVDYNRIDVKRTQTGLDPDEGFTAGSMSVQHSGSAIRLASATTRHYLIDLAADVLGNGPKYFPFLFCNNFNGLVKVIKNLFIYTEVQFQLIIAILRIELRYQKIYRIYKI